MSELKDPKIKLFGKTIELPENSSLAAAAVDESSEPGSAQSYEHAVGDGSNHDPPCSSDSMVEDRHLMSEDAEEEESVKPPSSSHEKHHPNEDDENPTGPPNPDEPKDHKPVVSIATPKPEEAQTETAGSPNEKALKKPDKILPCPRCNSMDTKFCYFNNYNVNQPRHFCKNCQRYWTAGGTMRNVPVGAGRRKNKSSSTATTHFRHLAVPPEILAFGGPVSPLCDSIASSLSIADQTGRAGSRNQPIRSEPNSGVPPPPPPPPPLPPQVPCYPGPAQLAYNPWGPVGWGPSGGGFPMPFYPTTPPSYWGWSVPCFVPMVGSGAGPNSPTLGKHSREGETAVAVAAKESDAKKCLWVPKTLRIDDPSEAAKSSIWAMLGLQNEGGSDSGKGGLFKAFGTESRGDGKAHVPEASTVLQANPAALSRALSFHESS